MKKTLLSLAAFSAFGFASAAHAEKVDICVFDLLGKSGESFQMAQEWALSRNWRTLFAALSVSTSAWAFMADSSVEWNVFKKKRPYLSIAHSIYGQSLQIKSQIRVILSGLFVVLIL